MRKIKKALISVSDKKNLKYLLRILNKYKIELISSGGTYKEIKKLKFKCLEVSEFTGSPEILGGRVKTFKRSFKFFLSETEINALFISLYVPPELINSILYLVKIFNIFFKFFLSDTEISAFLIFLIIVL